MHYFEKGNRRGGLSLPLERCHDNTLAQMKYFPLFDVTVQLGLSQSD